MSKMFCEVWLAVSELHGGIMGIMPITINRSARGTCMTQLHQLKVQVQSMVAPVVIARTGVTCY